MGERPLVLDVRGGHVQHNRDSVTDEHRDGAISEVRSAIIERHNHGITLGYSRAAKQFESVIEGRGPPLVGDQRHLLLEARWRKIDLDGCAPPDAVVLQQHDAARRRHDSVRRRSRPFHRLQREPPSVLPHQQLGAFRLAIPAQHRSCSPQRRRVASAPRAARSVACRQAERRDSGHNSPRRLAEVVPGA